MKKRVLALLLVFTMVFGMMTPSYGTSVEGGAEADDPATAVSDSVDESSDPATAVSDSVDESGDPAADSSIDDVSVSTPAGEEDTPVGEDGAEGDDAADSPAVGEDGAEGDDAADSLAAGEDGAEGDSVSDLEDEDDTEGTDPSEVISVLGNAFSALFAINSRAYDPSWDLPVYEENNDSQIWTRYIITTTGVGNGIGNGTTRIAPMNLNDAITAANVLMTIPDNYNAAHFVFVTDCAGGGIARGMPQIGVNYGEYYNELDDLLDRMMVFLSYGNKTVKISYMDPTPGLPNGNKDYTVLGLSLSSRFAELQVRNNNTLIIGENVQIDLPGGDGSRANGMIVSSGTLKVQGEIRAKGYTNSLIQVNDGGSLHVAGTGSIYMPEGTITKSNYCVDATSTSTGTGATLNIATGAAIGYGMSASIRCNGLVTATLSGDLTGNSDATGSSGDGIIMESSNSTRLPKVTINGGTISGYPGAGLRNNASSAGDRIVTMNAGTISGNSVGVNMAAGTFIMSGGTISGNSSYGVNMAAGTFTMSDGSITGNSNNGVNMASGSSFTMSGGTISGNTGAGVYIPAGASFNMTNGTIQFSGSNKGVSLTGTSTNASFTMSGGTIENTAAPTSSDGTTTGTDTGVNIADGSRFTMSGGTIRNGSKGVNIADSGTFNMSGGTITGSSNGVYLTTGGTFNMSGSTTAINSTAGTSVYLTGGTFNMDGGTISGSGYDGASANNGGTIVMRGGTITNSYWNGILLNGGAATLSGGTISGNNSNGVRIAGSNDTFTMNGGTIEGSTSVRPNTGHGVKLDAGTFTMSGTTATIRNNVGNGVNVAGGTSTLSGGTISGNSNGVNVAGGTSTLSGGTISGNSNGVNVTSGTATLKTNGTTITGNTGNGVNITGGSFTMESNTAISSNTGNGVSITGGSFTINSGCTISNNTGNGVNIGTSGSFTMGSGITISGNSGRGVNMTGGSFNMNGGTISSNSGGVSVTAGSFTMTDGTISGNTATNGGGVYVTGGTFDMNGGTISSNTAIRSGTSTTASRTGAGGGVLVDGGTFTMTDGTISGNNSHYDGPSNLAGDKTSGSGGGGVALQSGAFNMEGGTISGNTANTVIGNNSSVSLGGGVNVTGGTFTMTDGTIGDNNQASYGAGVSVVNSNGKFDMNGGAIQNNTASATGGGVYVAGSGTFTMTAGTISSNTASSFGGGVDVRSQIGGFGAGAGTFTMSGGTISGNRTTSVESNGYQGGGGIRLDSGVFTMTGGTIEDNESANRGGGVLVYTNPGNSYTITGGSIRNNTSVIDGAGVECYWDDVKLGGDVQISGNTTTDGTPSNLFLGGAGRKVTVTSPLTNVIGVSHKNAVDGTVFAQGDGAAASADKFTDESGTFIVTVQDNQLVWSEIAGCYVSANGSDTSGDGTRNNPYATLTKAIAEVDAGGIIYVMSDLTEDGYDINLNKNVTIMTDPVRDDGLCTVPEGENAIVKLTFTAKQNNDMRDTVDQGFIRVYGNTAPTLTLQDITFSGEEQVNSEGIGSVFRVGVQNSNVFMTGHIVLTNTKITGFTTEQGAIATPGANGVGANVTMNPGSSITGNTSTSTGNATAGGLTIWGTSNLTMDGAEISGNTGPNGGVYVNNGTLTITNSTIRDNIGTNGTGGIKVNDGSLIIQDAEITGNTGIIGGIATGVSTTIENSTISNNTSSVSTDAAAGSSAGGISVQGNTTTIRGCTIENNQVTNKGWGGGIFIAASGNVVMEDYSTVDENGQDISKGNTVTGNTCAGDAVDRAGGIHASGSLTLSGNVTVTGNTNGNGASNVVLNTSAKKITLAGTVTGTVGVSQKDEAMDLVFAQEAATATGSAAASADNFSSDSGRYEIGVTPAGNELIWTDPTQIYIKAAPATEGEHGGNDTTGLGTRNYPYLTFNKAVTEVQDGGTIYVMSDLTEAGYNIGLQKNVTIMTDSNRDGTLCTVSEGQNAIVKPTFTNSMNTTEFTADEDQAFIRVYGTTVGSGPTLTLENITFSGEEQANTQAIGAVFRVGTQGGGTNPQTGHIILDNGAAIRDFTTQQGAISTPGAGSARSNVTMNPGSSITGNTATNDGNATAGGLTIWGTSSLTMTGGTISNNRGSNGGVYVNNGTVKITDSTISNNTGDIGTGGIKVNNGSLTIQDAEITGNTGTIGGIATGVSTTIENSTISNNTSNTADTSNSGSSAGGISVQGNTTTIRGCTITGNQVTGKGWGGGIFIGANASVVMENYAPMDEEGNPVTGDDGEDINKGNTVTNNICAGTDVDRAGGIHASGSLTLSGDVDVTGNTNDNGDSNVVLNVSTKKIILAGEVTGSVGVTQVGATHFTTFAERPTNNDTLDLTASADAFFHDQDQFGVGKILDGGNRTSSLVWGNYVAQIVKNKEGEAGNVEVMSKYASLADAVAKYDLGNDGNTVENGYRIELLDEIGPNGVGGNRYFDVYKAVTIDKTVYLDLVGHSIEEVDVEVTENGKLYGLDSASEDYAGSSAGTIENVSGRVEVLTDITKPNTNNATQKITDMHYVAVKDGNAWSFHRFNIQVQSLNYIVDTSYKVSDLFFWPCLQGDEAAIDAMKELGVTATETGTSSSASAKLGETDKDTVKNNAKAAANKAALYRGIVHRSKGYTNNTGVFQTQYDMQGYLKFLDPNDSTGNTTAEFSGTLPCTYSLMEIMALHYQVLDQDMADQMDALFAENGLTTEWTAAKTAATKS